MTAIKWLILFVWIFNLAGLVFTISFRLASGVWWWNR